MESFGDKVGSAAAESSEVIDERAGERGDSPRTESLYGPGVPTAESFADDVPVEWLHEEDGSSSDGFAP